MSAPDGVLARECRQGDKGAFRELVLRHRGAVFAVVRAIVMCPDEAEDVTQEAFLCAYRAIGRYDPNRDFGTWIRAIAVNCAISALRRRRCHRLPSSAARVPDVPATGAGPDERATQEELRSRVRQAIERLPLRQRLAVTLFSLDGLDLVTTAEAMGCSVGALKSHLHRAREKLATALAEYVEED